MKNQGRVTFMLPVLPYSIRRFLNDGGDLATLCDEALDELGRMVIFDRVYTKFQDWDKKMNDAFGAIEGSRYPEIIWRRWDSEIANNDGNLADRIAAQLPYVVTKKWKCSLENELRDVTEGPA